ncbi:hypothetical protein DA2_1269 [Desulfovibrio sp. A2]|nr:hypothetical protein DA2_1269 [Desulfovibrio sp. A2]
MRDSAAAPGLMRRPRRAGAPRGFTCRRGTYSGTGRARQASLPCLAVATRGRPDL